MTRTFSKNIQALKPSAIREILKAATQPGMIPFAAGNPAPESFPSEAIQTLTQRLLQEHPTECLQYGVTEGYEPLRALLREQSFASGLTRAEDDVLVTAGAQQVMDLAAAVFCAPGDLVVTENPSFIGSLNAFRAQGLQLRGVSMEPDGMDLHALETLLTQEHKKIKLIYTIPNFQNPTGITMSAKKRRNLYELALKFQIPILEDNPYGDLYYEAAPPPSIKSLDSEGLVIYAGSFSKTLAPGLRVGYALAPRDIHAKLTVVKQIRDVHTPLLNQRIVFEWLTTQDIPAHLDHLRALYRTRRDSLCSGLDESKLVFEAPTGGLFLWGRCPNGVSARDYIQRALQKNVALVPGTAFSVDTDPAPEDPIHAAVRLNFSTPTLAQLQEGVQKLCALEG